MRLEDNQKGKGKGRHTVRPSGAHKLLTMLLYGNYPHMHFHPNGVIKLESIAKLARRLGTKSPKVRMWLEYLETSGYLELLTISEDRRQAALLIRRPPNV